MKKRVDNVKLADYLRGLKERKFTGKVTLNFFMGSVSNLNVGSEPAIWETGCVKVK